MPDAENYCERVVREADKDRFLATLFAPACYRSALFALYAFDAEIAGVADRVTQPLAGEVRLQWWHDVVTGKSPEQAVGSPIATALIETVRRFGVPERIIVELIETRRFDLYPEPVATLNEFDLHAARSFGSIFEGAARILSDGAEPGISPLSRHAGIAFAIVRLLAAFPAHAARGKIDVPAEIFQRHHARPEDVLAGQVTSAWRAALMDMRRHATLHLDRARMLMASVSGRVRIAFLPLALVRPGLARMEQSGHNPLRPAGLAQWRKQWILWRAARDLPRFL